MRGAARAARSASRTRARAASGELSGRRVCGVAVGRSLTTLAHAAEIHGREGLAQYFASFVLGKGGLFEPGTRREVTVMKLIETKPGIGAPAMACVHARR